MLEEFCSVICEKNVKSLHVALLWPKKMYVRKCLMSIGASILPSCVSKRANQWSMSMVNGQW